MRMVTRKGRIRDRTLQELESLVRFGYGKTTREAAVMEILRRDCLRELRKAIEHGSKQ